MRPPDDPSPIAECDPFAPCCRPARHTGREQQVEGRIHVNVAEITNEAGEVLSRSTGTFIAVDAEKLFASFIRR